jgi:hypothetical protein
MTGSGTRGGFAGDAEQAAGFVDGGVAVEQLTGCPVEVVDAAVQLDRLMNPGQANRQHAAFCPCHPRAQFHLICDGLAPLDVRQTLGFLARP